MKKIVLASAVSVFLSLNSLCQATRASVSTPAKKFQNLVGSWEIIGEQDSGGGLEIVDSATILIRFMGEEKKLTDYKIDFSRAPFWFDFSAKDSASTLNFKSLIEFVNDDMLKWQVFTDGERVNHFTSATGELYYLKKVRPKSNAAYYSGNSSGNK
jgi:hypothetical protein